MEGRTDGRTDTPSYRDAGTQLKKPNYSEIQICISFRCEKVRKNQPWEFSIECFDDIHAVFMKAFKIVTF